MTHGSCATYLPYAQLAAGHGSGVQQARILQRGWGRTGERQLVLVVRPQRMRLPISACDDRHSYAP